MLFENTMNDQTHLRNIEIVMYKKFRHRETDLFYWDGDVLGYDEMIDNLAKRVQQFCFDEEMELSEISTDQWNEWLYEYELPEDRCFCHRGCFDCLGTQW